MEEEKHDHDINAAWKSFCRWMDACEYLARDKDGKPEDVSPIPAATFETTISTIWQWVDGTLEVPADIAARIDAALWVRDWRDSLGDSLESFAVRIGITKQCVWNYETASRPVPDWMRRMRRLADRCGQLHQDNANLRRLNTRLERRLVDDRTSPPIVVYAIDHLAIADQLQRLAFEARAAARQERGAMLNECEILHRTLAASDTF